MRIKQRVIGEWIVWDAGTGVLLQACAGVGVAHDLSSVCRTPCSILAGWAWKAHLWDDGQLLPQRIQCNAGSVHAVQQDGACVDVNEPEKAQHQTALAAACGSETAQRAAGKHISARIRMPVRLRHSTLCKPCCQFKTWRCKVTLHASQGHAQCPQHEVRMAWVRVHGMGEGACAGGLCKPVCPSTCITVPVCPHLCAQQHRSWCLASS